MADQMPDLASRVEERIRSEWPGTTSMHSGGVFVAPDIREGGATDTLVNLMVRIIREEQDA